jgi:ElaB/YqjD/DUF883 family membrane-anchored ribosome-binding protein
MSTNPEQIRQEIQSTRAELSDDVNALTESVRPSSVARRQVDKVRGGVASVKDSVMGTAENATDSVSGAAGGAKSAVRRQARGNPMVAGAVAFGVGWLVSSLLPATSAERQGAAALKEKAQPLAENVGSQLSSAAQDVAQNLKEPARDAVEQVKASAADSASTVKDEAASTASDVKDSSQQAAEEVRRQS